MKKFYTDPLQAAYMGREFGIVYATKSKIDAWSDRETPTIISEAGMHNSPHELYTVISNEIVKNNAVYIHEDSLPIFKPQVGDLVESEEMNWFAPIEKIESYFDYAVARYGKDYNDNYDDTKEKCDAATEVDKKVLVLHGMYEPEVSFWEGHGKEYNKIILRDGKQFFTPQEE